MSTEVCRLAIRYPFVRRPGAVRALKPGEEPIAGAEYTWPEENKAALIQACEDLARTGFDQYARRIGCNGVRVLNRS